MKILILTIITYLFTSTTVLAESKLGSISGKINFCNNNDVAGMQVFIPGKPHVVITGADGMFLLSNVPQGEYTLGFMMNGKMLGFNQHVNVQSGQETSFDKLQFCENGVSEVVSSNQSILTIPEEQVILKAPDCNSVSEDSPFLINHGQGICSGGKVVVHSCNSGYSDCDEKPANGCETDINSDAKHCGGCFNECSELESCELGLC